jgi:hypothetical protein
LGAYETRLGAYNRKVSSFNDQGGAPPGQFAALEAERRELDRESAGLQATTGELNTLIANINELGDRGQALVDSYNREVEIFNDNFGFSREFTQGDYQGDRINIYKFSDVQELEQVLAHEFGHALGIDHVDVESSLMYYLLEETNQSPTLSAADSAAFTAVCGTGEEFDQTVRRTIRDFLTLIK